MEALRIADKEGWDIALAYLSEELVTGTDKEKRLKKARKETVGSRVEKKSRPHAQWAAKPYAKNDDRRDKNGNYRPYYSGSFSKKSSNIDNLTCWSCNRLGHVATNCPIYSSKNNYRY